MRKCERNSPASDTKASVEGSGGGTLGAGVETLLQSMASTVEQVDML